MLERWQHLGRNTRRVGVSVFLWSVGEGLWLFIQPLYLDALGASPQQIGLILAIAGLGRFLVMIPAGILADRFGAKAAMLPGWGLGMIGVVIIAGAPDIWWVAPGFFLYGMSALAIPVINLYIVQSIQADRTATRQFSPQEALTFMEALLWAGQIVSPAIGGLLAGAFSLRAVFWISAFWFLMSFLSILSVEAYPPPAGATERLRTRLRQYGTLLRRSEFLLPYGLFMVAFVAVFMGFNFAPKYLEDVYEIEPAVIGALGSVLALGSFTWNVRLGKRQPWQSFALVLLLSSVAFVLLLITGFWSVLLIAYFIMGALMVLRPVATGIMAKRTPPRQQGAAFGMVDTVHAVGTLLGPAIAGVLYAQEQALPFFVAVVLMSLSLLGVVWLARREQRAPAELFNAQQ